MFAVGCTTTLVAAEPLSPDEVSDLIAALVDELDKLCGSADVSTRGTGRSIEVEIQVEVAEEDGMDAMLKGFSCIRAGLHAAGVGTPGMEMPRDLQASLRSLQSA